MEQLTPWEWGRLRELVRTAVRSARGRQAVAERFDDRERAEESAGEVAELRRLLGKLPVADQWGLLK
jgi:hypothetical protein